MKDPFHAIFIFAGVLTALALVSCTKEPDPALPNGGVKGKTIMATFNLTPEFEQQVTVKTADGSEDNPRFRDITVIQMASDGSKLLQLPVYYFPGGTMVGDDYLVKFPMLAEESKIVFVANVASVQPFSNLTLESTEADVMAVTKAIGSESDLTMNKTGYVIMSGTWSGTPSASEGITGQVGMSRAIAKVTLHLDANLPDGDVFVLQSVQVKQVPSVLGLYRPEEKLGVYPYPSLSAARMSNYPAQTITDVSFTGGSASAKQTYVWNLPENARGIGKATDPKNKTAETAPDGEKDFCTYVEISGVYTWNNGASNEQQGDYTTSYRLYLGGNNTDDYNLLRNRLYTVNVTLRGRNTADMRIDSQPYFEDLSAPKGTANCYIVSKPKGRYKFNCTKMGNGSSCPNPSSGTFNGTWISSGTLAPDDVMVLWETGDAGSVIYPGSVELSADGKYISFRASATIGGNAVIAAMKEGAVIWSWHIWSTTYDPETDHDTFMTSAITNNKDYNKVSPRSGDMMKCNLGAIGIIPNSDNNIFGAYGLLYQWGRKDPFIGTNQRQISGSESTAFGDYTAKTTNAAGHEWKVVRDVTAAGNKVNYRASLDYVTAHPTHFINVVSTLGDWMYASDKTTEQDHLWGNPTTSAVKLNPAQGFKTMYDPCPPGWRVPPADTWTSFSKSGYGTGQANDRNTTGIFSYGWVFYSSPGNLTSSPTSFYPAAGFRSYSDGKMSMMGYSGKYWSSSTFTTSASNYGSILDFNTVGVQPIYLSTRAYGYPVRCIRE